MKQTILFALYLGSCLALLPGEETDTGSTGTAKPSAHITGGTDEAAAPAETATPLTDTQTPVEQQEPGELGYASWYAGKFQGRLTANGERFDTNKLTAAHKTLPFNTLVKVTNLENNLSVIVRINDRGPFVAERIIDLSRAAAEQIAMVAQGLAKVRVEVIGQAKTRSVYTIQVGTYAEKANALRMQERLKLQRLNATLEKTPAGLTRVLLKGLTREEAEKAQRLLKKLGLFNTLLKKETTVESP